MDVCGWMAAAMLVYKAEDKLHIMHIEAANATLNRGYSGTSLNGHP